VQETYLRSLPRGERAQAEREGDARAGDLPEGVPPVVELTFAFPYDFGPDVVAALLRAGGNARVNAAFTKPPASTEQVIDPRRYLNGDDPRPVPVPRADRPAFDDGEIGYYFLRLMLGAELSFDAARDASDGWGGDRYVAWRDGDRTCVRMDFVMDSPVDHDQLVRALGEWAARRRGSASSSGASLITCG
jgi:hypothetical protein